MDSGCKRKGQGQCVLKYVFWLLIVFRFGLGFGFGFVCFFYCSLAKMFLKTFAFFGVLVCFLVFPSVFLFFVVFSFSFSILIDARPSLNEHAYFLCKQSDDLKQDEEWRPLFFFSARDCFARIFFWKCTYVHIGCLL